VLGDLSSKYVDFAGQLGGAQAAVQYLWHTAWPDGQHRYNATEQAVQSVGVELRSRGITDIAEADDSFAALKNVGAKVIIIQPSPFTYRHRNQLISTRPGTWDDIWLATNRKGGRIDWLWSDYAYLYGEVGSYVVRILRARSRPICQSRNPRSLHWSSTSRTPRLSA
jgi:hypothetical protein